MTMSYDIQGDPSNKFLQALFLKYFFFFMEILFDFEKLKIFFKNLFLQYIIVICLFHFNKVKI